MTGALPSTNVGQPRRLSITRAATLLAGANAVAILSGFVTAPLVARALGPEGRGLVAAILVPLSLITQLSQFSLGDYAGQKVARGIKVATAFASLVPLSVGCGLVGWLVLVLLSGTLAGSHHAVVQFLVIGGALLPLSVIGGLLAGLATGRQLWGLVSLWQACVPLLYTVPVVVLAIVGALSVKTVVIATLGSSIAGLLFFAPAGLRKRDGWRVDLSVTREAISYGARALPGVASVMGNGRLDQILMLSLAGSRQLGLYAVAVTFAGTATFLISSIAIAIYPSVAAGEHELIPRACRLSLGTTIICASGGALIAYPMFRLLFGRAFEDAIGMTLILLVAQLPAAGSTVIGYGLRSMGHPGRVSIADSAALVITVPALFVLLPVLGGVGAALVSLCAYTATFALLLRYAVLESGLPASAFVAVRRSDLAEALRQIRAAGRRVISRH
jgi:O-antigen/teichoic acid export membrane protein